MLAAVLILAGLILLTGVILLARWVHADHADYADREEEDEDTVWADVREWGLLQRLFGQKPLRLPRPASDREGAGDS